MADQSLDGTLQTFECEVCDQKYRIECDYPIDRITVECSRCGDYSAWCYPVSGSDRSDDEAEPGGGS